VVARRLAENADVSILLLEAGGSDDDASIKDASASPSLSRWQTRLGLQSQAKSTPSQIHAKPNPRQAKSTIERTCHSNGYGQGFGWRVDGGVGEI